MLIQLEDDVARQRLDHVLYCSTGVAHRGRRGQFEQRGRTVLQDRNGKHALSICATPEQADESLFDHRLPGSATDRNARQADRTVNG